MIKKIALITGATSGIGEATARRLAANNFNLIITGRRVDRLEKLANSLKETYGTLSLSLPLDVRNEKAIQMAMNTLPLEWQQINVLVNNAGLASGLGTIEEGNINDWEVMIDTNLKGLLYVTKHTIPFLKEQPFSHIINIGSIAGKEVYMNGNVYCATKHAVDALNKSMRIELSKYPVKVTAIHPGAVETEFSIVRFHGNETRAKSVYEGFDNLLADDIADAIEYVISRPNHVNINELTIMPTAQPIASLIHRK